jgi:methionyl-tRNA formyltransferase
MESSRMRLVFMGTPEFAVPSLSSLLATGHEIVAVVTAPDKPKGRGLKRVETPVKDFAKSRNLSILQPESLKDPSFFQALKSLDPDLIVIVAFRILPMEIVNLPKKGTINLHASLLPKYRGAAPIQWAIAKGETETGVTIFFLNEVIDGGDIIRQENVQIGTEETAGELYERLKTLGAEALKACVMDIGAGTATPFRQRDETITYAPKLKKEDGKIDFTKPAQEIYNLIRGFTPFPGAYSFLHGKRILIIKSACLPEHTQKKPGTIISGNQEGIKVQTGLGVLNILRLKPENRKEMSVQEFLSGTPLKDNDLFN